VGGRPQPRRLFVDRWSELIEDFVNSGSDAVEVEDGHGPFPVKTLGTIRQRLVARLAPEILNPFDRTPEREATLRAAIGAILEDPELDLDEIVEKPMSFGGLISQLVLMGHGGSSVRPTST